MRETILTEIKRLAAENGGTPPGKRIFASRTGISEAKWRGIHWLSWSDALKEAGFAANDWNARRDTDEIAIGLADLTRKLHGLPSWTEIRFERSQNGNFPAHSTVANHFPTKNDMAVALAKLAASDAAYSDLLDYLPEMETGQQSQPESVAAEGYVYLLQSGGHYKIGRSDDIERRFREIKIALPEAVTLVHTIRTDDPAGIEAYWHRRFASKRANGEWFALSADDVRAFKRRKFQ